MPKYHVATWEEEMLLLPAQWNQNMVGDSRYEFVFMVNEDTNQIDHGHVVDTLRSVYADFTVMQLSDGTMDAVSFTNNWKPCEQE